MSKEKRRNYSKKFKVNAVRMITQEGSKASKVARELDIQANMFYLWKRKYLGSISRQWQKEIQRWIYQSFRASVKTL